MKKRFIQSITVFAFVAFLLVGAMAGDAKVPLIGGGNPYINLDDVMVTKVVTKQVTSIVSQDLWMVEGGPIKVVEIVGVVTTAIQDSANASIKLLVDPDEPATNTDICIATLISNDAAGTVLTLTGTFSDAIVETTNGVVAGLVTKFIVPEGMIEMNSVGTATGAITWCLRYEPLAAGVTVTAQ